MSDRSRLVPSEARPNKDRAQHDSLACFSCKDTEFTDGNGAGSGTRTHDLLITNQLLYQLSYASVSAHSINLSSIRQHS